MRHDERRIYFKNIYKTDFRLKTLTFKKKRKRNTLIKVDGLISGVGGGGGYPGGLISGITYSLANGWAYIRGAYIRGA